MRSQRNGTQSIEIGRVTLIGVRIRQKGIRLGQIVFALKPIPLDCSCRSMLTNIFIVEHCRIAAVHHITQQTESGIDIEMNGQELVAASHLAQLHQIIKAKQFGTPRKTYFTHAPYVITDNHIATHKLKTLTLRHKTNTKLTVMHFTHYGVYIISVVLLGIGCQRRQKFII